jgi:hypothetical protein
MTPFDTDLSKLLGIDLDDPDIQAAAHDADTVMSLISQLVRYRIACRITLEEVAHHMQAPVSFVADFERLGGDPTLSVILCYARAIGMTITVGAKVDAA